MRSGLVISVLDCQPRGRGSEPRRNCFGVSAPSASTLASAIESSQEGYPRE